MQRRYCGSGIRYSAFARPTPENGNTAPPRPASPPASPPRQATACRSARRTVIVGAGRVDAGERVGSVRARGRACEPGTPRARGTRPIGETVRVRRTYAHAGSRTRVTSMGGLYDAATLRAPMPAVGPPSREIWAFVGKSSAAGGNTTPAHVCCQTGTCPNAFNVDMRATVELGWSNSRVRRSARKRRRRTRVGATRSRNFREDRRASKHAPTCAQTAVWRSLRHTPKFQKLAAP